MICDRTKQQNKLRLNNSFIVGWRQLNRIPPEINSDWPQVIQCLTLTLKSLLWSFFTPPLAITFRLCFSSRCHTHTHTQVIQRVAVANISKLFLMLSWVASVSALLDLADNNPKFTTVNLPHESQQHKCLSDFWKANTASSCHYRFIVLKLVFCFTVLEGKYLFWNDCRTNKNMFKKCFVFFYLAFRKSYVRKCQNRAIIYIVSIPKVMSCSISSGISAFTSLTSWTTYNSVQTFDSHKITDKTQLNC